jgi:hypothetical protein
MVDSVSGTGGKGVLKLKSHIGLKITMIGVSIP